ncbi:MAG: CRTAC1 family protein, partial [Candidatus Caldarchaeum sp.]
LYVVNIESERNALYHNNGDGTFTDVTLSTGTEDVGDGRTCAWVDFDGDGRVDLFTTNHLSPTRLYRNLGGGRFEDVAEDVGISTPIDVFAATWGDYNGDGFIDAFLYGHLGFGLFENSGNTSNFIVLSLVGDGINTNRSAIGTRVEVRTVGGVGVREVSGGRGCCEQDMLPLHFGVGGNTEADILIKWTSGTECFFPSTPVDGGRVFLVREADCSITEL